MRSRPAEHEGASADPTSKIQQAGFGADSRPMQVAARPLASQPSRWGTVIGWAAASVALAFGAFFRVTVDALTCGDDGSADYGDVGAQRYCAVLEDRIWTPGATIHARLDPSSVWWFVLALPIAVVAGIVALRSRAHRAAVVVIAAAAAIALLVLLPATRMSLAFVGFYVVPFAAAVVASLLAFAVAWRRLAFASLGAGAAAWALLLFFSRPILS